MNYIFLFTYAGEDNFYCEGTVTALKEVVKEFENVQQIQVLFFDPIMGVLEYKLVEQQHQIKTWSFKLIPEAGYFPINDGTNLRTWLKESIGNQYHFFEIVKHPSGIITEHEKTIHVQKGIEDPREYAISQWNEFGDK